MLSRSVIMLNLTQPKLPEGLKALFKAAIKYLSTTQDFKNISLKGKIMTCGDKSSFYSYVRGSKTVNNSRKVLNFSAVIYANLRDISTQEKLLDAIAHEAAHIKEGDFIENKLYFRKMLRDKFGI